MRGLLQCSVKMGFVTLLITGLTGLASEAPSSYSQMALENLAARALATKTPSLTTLPLAPLANHQNLRLDCEKIGQAQRGLKDARKRGARLIPAAPVAGLAVEPPTRDEIYHVSRNEERFADLAQQFQCARR